MTGPSFDALVYAWIGIALLSFVALLRVRAPYGRYTTETWGPTVPHRRGWILMEVVSPAAFLWFFLGGAGPKTGPAWVFAALWTAHYVNRAVIYPLRLPRSTRRMPVAIMLLAVVFNAMNGFLNGHYLGDPPVVYDVGWFRDPRFLLGAALFVIGAGINLWSDRALRALRRPGETGYRVPEGGLFRWVSCPNYLGEIIEWVGFAILTWSTPALSFALWTAANLIPRALSHHRWYRSEFDDYPQERTALVPFLL